MSKSLIKNLLRFAMSGGLVTWLALKTDWPQVARDFGKLDIRWWLLALVVLVGAQCVSIVRWRLFAQALSVEASATQMTGYYFTGMFFNLILPTSVGGDVVRAWYLQGRSGKRLASFLSVFVERLSGLIVLVALACVAVLVSPLPLPAWMHWSVWTALVCGITVLVTLPLLVRWGPSGLLRMQKVQALLELLRSPRLIITTTLLSLAVQTCSVVQAYCVGRALGTPAPATFFWILVPMVSILTLLPSINGVGVRETSTALLLAPFGVSQTEAVTFAFLWFAVSVSVSLLGGLFYLFGSFPKPQALEAPAEELVENGSLHHHPDQGRTRQLGQAA